ncbi:YraN family protein [Roseovarius rhodophyticola]|uniref:YraN family protein n=1 Tax=Roseovarius rhodophyticola TaxID=3080827 RepID=A0ABZ2TF15_9RHOB|nr:YraN family protein [Roseovarius sp. W115]MDV2930390.1 YraN family protein [Roseovarius sp. W115]
MSLKVPSKQENTHLMTRKSRRGQLAYLKGDAAEASVAAAYKALGATILETRWRGKGGEIDLIFLHQGVYVFCEVKASVTHEAARHRLLEAQMRRIHLAASEYLAHTPNGQLSDVRFDLALVNARGEVEILQNAFGHF